MERWFSYWTTAISITLVWFLNVIQISYLILYRISVNEEDTMNTRVVECDYNMEYVTEYKMG